MKNNNSDETKTNITPASDRDDAKFKHSQKSKIPKQTVIDTAADTGTDNKKLRRDSFIAKIFCVLGALIIWLYVMETDSPDYKQIFYSVPVALTNTSMLENMNGLSVYSGYDLTVDVTVNGKKSIVNKISPEDIQITADVSGITEPGTHSVSLDISLPSGLTLFESSQSAVEIYTDEKGTVTVPLEVRISNVIVDNGNVLGDPQPEYSQISVTGPKSVLDTIASAQVSLDIGRVSSSVTAIGKIALYSATSDLISNPYLKLSRSEVTVSVPVYKYKNVPLTVAFKYGYFNNNNVDIILDPTYIELRGDPEVIDNMTSLAVATIDEKSILENESRLVSIVIPEGLESVDGIDKVTVDITHKNTITRKIIISDVSVIGISEGLTYSLPADKLIITLRGAPEALRTVKAADIKATVDLSGYTEQTSGTVTENVDITIDTSENIYEIGNYTIQVTLGNA